MADRFQHQVIFWLNLMDREQEILAEYIAELRARRKFAPTVRLALELMRDLDDGNVDVLKALYPDIADRLTEATLDDIRQLIRASQPAPVIAPVQLVQPISSGNAKQLNAPQFDAPDFDVSEDDEDEWLFATVEAETTGQAGLNFLQSLKNLQQ